MSMRVKIPASGFTFWHHGKRYVFSNNTKKLNAVDYPSDTINKDTFLVVNLGPPKKEDMAYLKSLIGLQYQARVAWKAFFLMGFDTYTDCRNKILYPALRMLKQR